MQDGTDWADWHERTLKCWTGARPLGHSSACTPSWPRNDALSQRAGLSAFWPELSHPTLNPPQPHPHLSPAPTQV